jgi:hypothetical protein
MATQWELLIEFEETVGWVISGAAPGPAGTVSLLLDRARVTVDAADPVHLVEFVAFADQRGEDIPAAALTACRQLLGAEAAAAVAAQPADGARVSGTPGPLWPAVAAAARAQFLYEHDTIAPRLAALRLLAAEYGLAQAGVGELLRRHAWEALPAAVALGRSAARDAVFLDRLPDAHRRDLAAALATLTEVLTTDEWDGSGSEPLNHLTALLTGLTQADLENLSRDPEGDGGDDGEHSARRTVPQFASDSAQLAVTDVNWSATSRQLRARLGELAAEAFAGAFASGELPGAMNIQIPFRVGTQVATGELVARVQAWTGEVLGEAALRVSGSPAGLPRGRCQVRVDQSAELTEVLAAGQGVHIDIALAVLPRLDSAGLRGVARRRARQDGVIALLARHAGNLQKEEAGWESSARMFAICGDAGRAAAARTLAADAAARALTARGAAASGTSQADGPDWAEILLRSWRRAAAELMADAAESDPADRIGWLRPLVVDLSEGASGAPELASASQRLAEAYLEMGADSAVAVALLREALRVRYARTDETAASLAARALAAAVARAEANPEESDDE